MSSASWRKACSAINWSRFSCSWLRTYWIASSTIWSVIALRESPSRLSATAMAWRSSSTLAQKAAMTAELRSTNWAKVSVMRSLMSLK
ncbi:hypothetical protein D3C81_1979150 [compost metagenome]